MATTKDKGINTYHDHCMYVTLCCVTLLTGILQDGNESFQKGKGRVDSQ